jgi:hypothetical protein
MEPLRDAWKGQIAAPDGSRLGQSKPAFYFAHAGRIIAALDVYDKEPLPRDHPFCRPSARRFRPCRPWEQLAAEPAKRTLSHQLPDLPADEGGQDPETLASIFPPNRKAG